jgi:hypothetical protein
MWIGSVSDQYENLLALMFINEDDAEEVLGIFQSAACNAGLTGFECGVSELAPWIAAKIPLCEQNVLFRGKGAQRIVGWMIEQVKQVRRAHGQLKHIV